MQCFAVRQDDVAKSRCDVDFHHPSYASLIRQIETLPNTALISEIIASPLISGFAAGKENRAQSGEESAPQIRPTQILPDGEIDLSDAYGIGSENISERDYLQSGEVLFNNTNSTLLVGKSAVFREPVAAVCSNHVTRLLLKDGIEPEFVEMVLNMLQQKGYFARLCTNFNNQAGVNTATLATVRIPFPSAEQREHLVADMLAAREERRAKLTEADALLAGIDDFMLEALGIAPPAEDTRRVFAVRLGNMPERLDPAFQHPSYERLTAGLEIAPVETHPLGNILMSISSGATPHRSQSSLYADSGIKFLRILNVDGGEIIDKDMKYITETVHNGQLARSQLDHGDVLMTITGRVGSAAVVRDEHLPANINQHIVRMRIDTARCLPEFLCEWLNSAVGLVLSNRYVSGGTRAALDYAAIRSIRVPLPRIADQERIVDAIATKRDETRRLQAEAEAGWTEAKRRFEVELLGTANIIR